MVAGPSEIVVVADAQNDPAWIAADLLSQAEHDPTSQSILFTDDADIITQVAQLFLISLILEPGRTFNLVVINALRATGDARFPLYMALVSMWGIAVPLAYFLGIMQGYGLVGIWLALACDEWVRGLAMFWRWRSRRWQNKILVET